MDFEKRVEFILEQQARLDAEFNAKLDAQKVRFDEQISGVHEILVRVTASQETTSAILATLAEKHVKLAENHAELQEAQKTTQHTVDSLAESTRELREAQKTTQQTVDSLAEGTRELREAQKTTQQNVDSLAEGLRELAEDIRELKEALSRLAATVERHIASHN